MAVGKRAHYSAEALEELVGWVITGDDLGRKFDPSEKPRREDYDREADYLAMCGQHEDGKIIRGLLDDTTLRVRVTPYTFMALVRLMQRKLLPAMQGAGIYKFLRTSYLGDFGNPGLFCREAERQKTAPHPVLAHQFQQYDAYMNWQAFAETYEQTYWFVDLNSRQLLPEGTVHVFIIPGGMR